MIELIDVAFSINEFMNNAEITQQIPATNSQWWIAAIIYVISFGFVVYFFQFLDWGKIIKKDKKFIGIVIYIICSMAVAFLVGSFILALTPYGVG